MTLFLSLLMPVLFIGVSIYVGKQTNFTAGLAIFSLLFSGFTACISTIKNMNQKKIHALTSIMPPVSTLAPNVPNIYNTREICIWNGQIYVVCPEDTKNTQKFQVDSSGRIVLKKPQEVEAPNP